MKAPLPIKALATFLAVWVVMFVINGMLYYSDMPIDTSRTFPISVVDLGFHSDGLMYLALFGLVFYLTMTRKWYEDRNLTLGTGVTLIVLGNLLQGSATIAFTDPISAGNIQYFHDALKIEHWQSWLTSFNQLQPSLLTHGKTHPPGAILLIYALMVDDSTLWVSVVLAILGLLSLLLVHRMFMLMGQNQRVANQMTLLYAVIPAVNVYTLVSIDAVIATCTNLAVVGLLSLNTQGLGCKDNNTFKGSLMLFAGLGIGSLLTFGTLFLWILVFTFSVYQLKVNRNTCFLAAFSFSGFGFLAVIGWLYFAYGFNYFEAFFTALDLENKKGMHLQLSVARIQYVLTRLENVAEILVFLSVWVAIVVMQQLKQRNYTDPYAILSHFSVAILLLIFLTGAYRTGETARACLFIVPFLIFPLRHISENLRISLISFAALQTVGMQLLGNFFW